MSIAKPPEQPGCARRVIDLRAKGERVVAWLEDDFHHFGLELQHDGSQVLAVRGHAERFPRNTCPGAIDILQEAVGLPLAERSTALGQHTNMRRHCTHLYDLLGLAIAHAARGQAHRRYDAVVPDRQDRDGVAIGGSTRPELYRDGNRVMCWQLQGDLITEPARYEGVSLGRGFRAWTESLDEEEAEAAHVLRRATLIALGRLINLQAMPEEAMTWMEGVCYSFQPEVFRDSHLTVNSQRDFTEAPSDLLAFLR
ncbi:MAG: DUF2889 domain-containing protein [Halioglobus sp.]|nr:DUF2889 domain-containing protein [Halioglobus sp.]